MLGGFAHVQGVPTWGSLKTAFQKKCEIWLPPVPHQLASCLSLHRSTTARDVPGVMHTQHSLVLHTSYQSHFNCQALKPTRMGKEIPVQSATSPLPPISACTRVSLRLGHAEHQPPHPFQDTKTLKYVSNPPLHAAQPTQRGVSQSSSLECVINSTSKSFLIKCEWVEENLDFL